VHPFICGLTFANNAKKGRQREGAGAIFSAIHQQIIAQDISNDY
jgi:hypothetical protein